MQPAQSLYYLEARPQGKVKGVAEEDLSSQFTQLLRGHALDGAIGAHRHKGRGFHGAAGKVQTPAPGGTIARQQLKKAHAKAPGRISMASP